MAFQDKIMFEIYRDNTYSREYRVVYFSELNEHNKDTEIDKAMLGDHVFDGYILSLKKERAMKNIDNLVNRLNETEQVDPEFIKNELAEFLAN